MSDDTMSGDLQNAIAILAADNARLCDRLVAAEQVVEAARRVASTTGYDKFEALAKLRVALEAHEIVRQGQ